MNYSQSLRIGNPFHDKHLYLKLSQLGQERTYLDRLAVQLLLLPLTFFFLHQRLTASTRCGSAGNKQQRSGAVRQGRETN